MHVLGNFGASYNARYRLSDIEIRAMARLPLLVAQPRYSATNFDCCCITKCRFCRELARKFAGRDVNRYNPVHHADENQSQAKYRAS